MPSSAMATEALLSRLFRSPSLFRVSSGPLPGVSRPGTAACNCNDQVNGRGHDVVAIPAVLVFREASGPLPATAVCNRNIHHSWGRKKHRRNRNTKRGCSEQGRRVGVGQTMVFTRTIQFELFLLVAVPTYASIVLFPQPSPQL